MATYIFDILHGKLKGVATDLKPVLFDSFFPKLISLVIEEIKESKLRKEDYAELHKSVRTALLDIKTFYKVLHILKNIFFKMCKRGSKWLLLCLEIFSLQGSKLIYIIL